VALSRLIQSRQGHPDVVARIILGHLVAASAIITSIAATDIKFLRIFARRTHTVHASGIFHWCSRLRSESVSRALISQLYEAMGIGVAANDVYASSYLGHPPAKVNHGVALDFIRGYLVFRFRRGRLD